MSTKYDDDIREAESRLIRDRQALVAQAEDLSAKARDMASSPKGLIAACAVGFILGELTSPGRSRQSRKPQSAQTADTTAKMGLGGLIGSALFAYARSRYGSPWTLGRNAWDYYAARQRQRRATMQARPPASTSSPTQSTVVRPARAPAGSDGVAGPVPAAAYSSLRSPEHHAG